MREFFKIILLMFDNIMVSGPFIVMLLVKSFRFDREKTYSFE